MREILFRFLIGGLFVSAFAVLSDTFRPRTFAGLFGAAPSVALASLLLTIAVQGKQTAVIESRSMILGAAALLVYSCAVSFVLLRFKWPVPVVSLLGLLLWMAAAFAFWEAV